MKYNQTSKEGFPAAQTGKKAGSSAGFSKGDYPRVGAGGQPGRFCKVFTGAVGYKAPSDRSVFYWYWQVW